MTLLGLPLRSKNFGHRVDYYVGGEFLVALPVVRGSNHIIPVVKRIREKYAIDLRTAMDVWDSRTQATVPPPAVDLTWQEVDGAIATLESLASTFEGKLATHASATLEALKNLRRRLEDHGDA